MTVYIIQPAAAAERPAAPEPALVNGAATKAARAEKNKRFKWEFDQGPTPALVDALKAEMQACVSKVCCPRVCAVQCSAEQQQEPRQQ
jgi:hypothetical protein